MKSIGVFEAKTQLSKLIESGEPVTITRHGKPVATLTPLRRDPDDLVARVRALRGTVAATPKEVTNLVRQGRR